MALRHLGLSRRSLAIAAALLGTVSLALGAPAILNKRAPEAAKAVEIAQATTPKPASRLALVIGNGKYPDANAPLTQPINDARAIGAALRREGFEVDLVENAGRDAIDRAVDRLTGRIDAQSVVLLFFGGYGIQAGRESFMIPVDAAIWKESDVRGYGIQAGRESFMIPVDAAIWKESDVRSQGVSIEAVLAAIKEKGARARIAVIDASRRNPYERRFRAFSHGLAPITAPDNALILASAAPGKVADDSKGHNSVLVTELLNNIGAKAAGAEAVFNKTRVAVSRASGGEQVPAVSSSLLEDIELAAGADEKSGG